MTDEINWKRLREKIAEGPFAPIPRPTASERKDPEEREEFLKKERARAKKYREENPEKCHAAEKHWRQQHPEKCREKGRRNYNAHKDDPEWMAAKAARQKSYVERHKNDPAFIEKRREAKRRYKERKKQKLL